MPFGIAMGEDGKALCPCCREWLWNCEKCWLQFHNGERHKDYEPPKYYGQSMMADGFFEKMERELGIPPPKIIIKADKNRPYREGEYH